MSRPARGTVRVATDSDIPADRCVALCRDRRRLSLDARGAILVAPLRRILGIVSWVRARCRGMAHAEQSEGAQHRRIRRRLRKVEPAVPRVLLARRVGGGTRPRAAGWCGRCRESPRPFATAPPMVTCPRPTTSPAEGRAPETELLAVAVDEWRPPTRRRSGARDGVHGHRPCHGLDVCPRRRRCREPPSDRAVRGVRVPRRRPDRAARRDAVAAHAGGPLPRPNMTVGESLAWARARSSSRCW